MASLSDPFEDNGQMRFICSKCRTGLNLIGMESALRTIIVEPCPQCLPKEVHDAHRFIAMAEKMIEQYKKGGG